MTNQNYKNSIITPRPSESTNELQPPKKSQQHVPSSLSITNKKLTLQVILH